jgi:hypothetical protein
MVNDSSRIIGTRFLIIAFILAFHCIAVKIGCNIDNKEIEATAVKNLDGCIAVAVFNPTDRIQTIAIQLNKKNKMITIDANTL